MRRARRARPPIAASARTALKDCAVLGSAHTLTRPPAYNLPSARKPSLICAGPALHPLILERVGHIQPHHAA